MKHDGSIGSGGTKVRALRFTIERDGYLGSRHSALRFVETDSLRSTIQMTEQVAPITSPETIPYMKETNSVSETKSKFEQAMVAPERTFDTPDQVVENEQLSLHEKKKVLETWRDNEVQLLRASGEGMAGGERPHLPLIEKALARLDDSKHGSAA